MNLKELAKALGLSPTTVSRALNGFPEVSEKTRIRVREAASASGYSPSLSAKSLATGKSFTIGHILPAASSDLANPIFGDFIAGAGEVYSRRGFRCLLNVVPRESEEETYRALAQQRAVDGFVVHAPKIKDKRIALLDTLGLPYLLHGRTGDERHGYDYVDVNNCRAFRRATEFLIQLGHRRIALLNGYEAENFAYRRRLGYQAALENAGLPYNAERVISREMTHQAGYDGFATLNAQDSPPTAYLCSSVVIALGVHRALSDAGLKLGEDISVITHSDDLAALRSGADVPLFTATEASVRSMGEKCAELLISKILNPNIGRQQDLREAGFIIGRSTGENKRD